MPPPYIVAAHRALRSLQRSAGLFSGLQVHRNRVSARVDSRLLTKPRSDGHLHWASDRGSYRDIWVSGAQLEPKRLFRLYFGSWGRGQRLSAYVVLFRRGQPHLEVRLSPTRSPDDGVVHIEHRLAFFGKRYKTPERLRNQALRTAERAGLAVSVRRTQLGQFDVPSGRLTPRPHEILRRIILCGLIKHSIGEAARAGEVFAPTPAKSSTPLKKKRERFPKGRRTKVDVLLDERFEAWGRHNRLLNRLSEYLEAEGYRIDPREPFDLLVRRGQRIVIIEAKAWNKANLSGALRAAAGQLLYYSYLFGRDGHRRTPQLVVAIPFPPAPELVSFLEETAGIGLIWASGPRFHGGRLAGEVLPELIT